MYNPLRREAGLKKEYTQEEIAKILSAGSGTPVKEKRALIRALEDGTVKIVSKKATKKAAKKK